MNHKVMLAKLRLYYPKIIASNIVGVQPMAGPAGSIFKLRKKYRPSGVNPRTTSGMKLLRDHHNYFLRLNDKRKRVLPYELNELRYPRVRLPNDIDMKIEAVSWLDDTLPKGSFIIDDFFKSVWFSSEENSILFSLAYAS